MKGFQLLCVLLLCPIIEAKGYSLGGSYHHSYSHRGRGYNGNYHTHHTHTYHGGGGSGGTINGLYALLVFVAVFLLLVLCVFLIQNCRRRSDGTWHVMLDLSSSSSDSDSSSDDDSESGTRRRRIVLNQRPTYNQIPNSMPQATPMPIVRAEKVDPALVPASTPCAQAVLVNRV